MVKLSHASKHIIRNIVGRLNSNDTDERVAEEVTSNLRATSKEVKKAVVKEALRVHHANQMLYKSVMTGRF